MIILPRYSRNKRREKSQEKTVSAGEVQRFVEDGVEVACGAAAVGDSDEQAPQEQETQHVACDLVVKCFGFEKPVRFSKPRSHTFSSQKFASLLECVLTKHRFSSQKDYTHTHKQKARVSRFFSRTKTGCAPQRHRRQGANLLPAMAGPEDSADEGRAQPRPNDRRCAGTRGRAASG
jgi:hypothetical protein